MSPQSGISQVCAYVRDFHVFQDCTTGELMSALEDEGWSVDVPPHGAIEPYARNGELLRVGYAMLQCNVERYI